jgi:hypothetical protein
MKLGVSIVLVCYKSVLNWTSVCELIVLISRSCEFISLEYCNCKYGVRGLKNHVRDQIFIILCSKLKTLRKVVFRMAAERLSL